MSSRNRLKKSKRARKPRWNDLPKKNKNDIIIESEGEKMAEVKLLEKKEEKVEDKKPFYTTPYTYKKTPEHPKKVNITNYPPDLSKQEFYTFLIQELVKGVSFCITYFKDKEDFELNFHDYETDKDEDSFMTIEANINAPGLPLYKPFRELAKLLGNSKVDFTVFAEYVNWENQKIEYFTEEDGSAFFVYDIAINENWVDAEDIKRLCDECNIGYMPVIYEGKYDQKIIDSFLKDVKSQINTAVPKYGLVIKSDIEDLVDHKRVAKVLLNVKEKPVVDDSEVEEFIETLMGMRMNESRMMTIDSAIKQIYPRAFEKDSNVQLCSILSSAVWKAKSIFFSDDMRSEAFKAKYEKELNRQLSNLFIKRYRVFQKGEGK